MAVAPWELVGELKLRLGPSMDWEDLIPFDSSMRLNGSSEYKYQALSGYG